MSNRPPTDTSPFEEMQATPEFVALRGRFRRFVLPMTAAFLVWYFTYVLLAAYATDFFAIKLVGNINVGLLFGLGQFVSTALITWAYVRWADRHLDPAAERMRDEVEAAVAQGADPTSATSASGGAR
ncbi:MAG: DUF485 domain-containing protein [Actinomycetales bacterium]